MPDPYLPPTPTAILERERRRALRLSRRRCTSTVRMAGLDVVDVQPRGLDGHQRADGDPRTDADHRDRGQLWQGAGQPKRHNLPG
jgi:hypothetical protein